ncbi:putative apses transcription factor protein [Venturia nashicola]|uniref:Putative apses transcription factor protein n=1 Tax=Venturia nashicola TaxID=86259 RepID=A0A4Z1PB95_9PEZI|nr:putative apses transcription factor protein [Venturia nashicola]TLD37752.1 putative apses transcription factor protein [Venturia nashicola]
MVPPKKRSLPQLRNPLVEPGLTPEFDVLVERRRLGHTSLNVKSGAVGLSPSTSPANLGKFDYAHLRVPLPKSLNGSGVHKPQKAGLVPESYFLMRRSSDGFISATGMFKVAFPWASNEEEKAEREYHIQIAEPKTGEEVAGNLWVHPDLALELADEYGLRPWIIALLSDAPIERGNKLDKAGEIATPPTYPLSPEDKKMFLEPDLPANTRARHLRSTSPSKQAKRQIATPRVKGRRTKAQKAAEEAATKENGTRESAPLEPTPSIADSDAPALEPPATEAPASEAPTSEAPADDMVRVVVDEVVEKVDDVETVHTTVKVKMPSTHPDLPLPDTAEGIIEQAREMVEEGRKLEAAKNANSKSLKRKVDEVEDAEEAESSAVQPAKKAKTETAMEATLKRERVKGRALVGIVTALAVGAIVPYFI